jgi:hypothetical protein
VSDIEPTQHQLDDQDSTSTATSTRTRSTFTMPRGNNNRNSQRDSKDRITKPPSGQQPPLARLPRVSDHGNRMQGTQQRPKKNQGPVLYGGDSS